MAAENNSGVQTIVAALILGICVIAGAMLIRSSVDQTAREVASLKEMLVRGPQPSGPSPTAGRPGAPDPNRRYSVNTQGSPSKGNERAKLAVVEFSDFQCPYCGAFATDVLPRLKASHVSKGLVKIAFRHLPIKQIHPDAFGAAQAAECSRRQGRFWEMHDLLFGARAPLDPPTVRNHAGAVGLQLDAFDLCMSGDSNLTVERDLRAAEALKLRGTPTFLIGTTQADGRVKIAKTIRGAKSEAAFRETFDRLLDR